MSFVPPYMGDLQTYVSKGVSFVGQEIPAKNLSSFQQSLHQKELCEFLSQPLSSKSEVIWDVYIRLKSQDAITRLASVNHAVDVQLSENKQEAVVKLSQEVDRKSVPNKDFVLYIRDEMVNRPTGLVSSLADGDQAVSISILPDFMNAKQRTELIKQ